MDQTGLTISRILHAGYVFACEDTRIAFDTIFENPFSRNCHAFPDVRFDEAAIRRERFAAVWQRWRDRDVDGYVPGPVGRLRAMAVRVGWTWPEPWAFRDRGGRLFRFLDMAQGAWEHEVREAARLAVWRAAEARRRPAGRGAPALITLRGPTATRCAARRCARVCSKHLHRQSGS